LTLRAFRVHALANQDIHSVINHYIDLQAAKAGTEFLVALEKAYKFIGQFPDAGSKRLGITMKLPELRTWSLTIFPYSLIYMSDVQGVDIFRLLHHKRDIPNYLNI
jgi:toxin ParE1/3/4